MDFVDLLVHGKDLGYYCECNRKPLESFKPKESHNLNLTGIFPAENRLKG